MLRHALSALLLSTATTVFAVPVEIVYSGVVTSTSGGIDAPALGSTVMGRVVFDNEPAPYLSCVGAPQTPQYAARCLSGAPYGSSLQTSVTTVLRDSLALEVFDNDLTPAGFSTPGDLISFSARQGPIFYSLMLFGPVSSFAGTSLPTIAAIESLLPDALVYGAGSSLPNASPSFQATLTSFSVSVVPEPAPLAALLLGLAVVGLALRKRDA
jgi:hypothetical protein